MDHPAHPDAVAHLRRVDPVLGQLIDRVGRVTPAPLSEGTHLGAIARAIVFQQLSGRAAQTIHGRFEEIYGGRPPTADQLLATPDERLRAVGLSRAKVIYLKDLAHRAVSGALPVDRLHELEDDPLMEALTGVKGIGRWTAQMFLMFRLGRPNVLPDLDLGVRKAIQRAYRLRRLPTPREVLARGAPWSPYASFAAWYLWRSLELPDTQASSSRRPRASKRARVTVVPTRGAVAGQPRRRSKRRTTVHKAAAPGSRAHPAKKKATPIRRSATPRPRPSGAPGAKTRA
jgi:DNA-3-methyladenine glycosylase II